jgi:AhpD family alkylhydroperoxidase
MPQDWPDLIADMNPMVFALRGLQPDVMKAFAQMAQAATASHALDTRTKELIALGISVAVRCDPCIAYHARAAVKAGATEAEVAETLGLAVYMGAGPSAMYAAKALEAARQFGAAAAPAP